jgi:lipoprotein signal peptidase
LHKLHIFHRNLRERRACEHMVHGPRVKQVMNMGRSNSLAHALTWIVDYLVLGIGLYSVQMIYCRQNNSDVSMRAASILTLTCGAAFSSLQIHLLWYAREQLYFWLLGIRVLNFKRSYQWSRHDLSLRHMWTPGARSRDESEYDRSMQTTFFDPS